MLPVIDCRRIKNSIGSLYMNICLTPDKKEVVFYADGYYYLSKDGIKVTRKRYIIP